jgi:hypothetical protein
MKEQEPSFDQALSLGEEGKVSEIWLCKEGAKVRTCFDGLRGVLTHRMTGEENVRRGEDE